MSKQKLLRKSQSHLELTLARNIKSNKKSFHKYLRGKKKTIENVGLMLKGTGVLVMQDMDKAEVLNVFFTSPFAKKTQFRNPQRPA